MPKLPLKNTLLPIFNRFETWIYSHSHALDSLGVEVSVFKIRGQFHVRPHTFLSIRDAPANELGTSKHWGGSSPTAKEYARGGGLRGWLEGEAGGAGDATIVPMRADPPTPQGAGSVRWRGAGRCRFLVGCLLGSAASWGSVAHYLPTLFSGIIFA